MTDSAVVEILTAIVNQNGTQFLKDRQSLENLLIGQNIMPQDQIEALAWSADPKVLDPLRAAYFLDLQEIQAAHQAQKLHQERGIDPHLALWAICHWGVTLNLLTSEVAHELLFKASSQSHSQSFSHARLDPQTEFSKGMVAFENFNWKEAQKHFEATLTLDKNHQAAADQLSIAKAIIQAYECYEKALIFEKAEAWSEAKSQIQQAIKLYPKESQFTSKLAEISKKKAATDNFLKGQVYHNQEKYKLAIKYYQSALDVYPNYSKAVMALSQIENKFESRKDGVIATILVALVLATVTGILGSLWIHRQSSQERIIQAQLESDLSQGIAEFDVSNFEAALLKFESVLGIEPNHPIASSYLPQIRDRIRANEMFSEGESYSSQQQWTEARNSYDLALQLWPDYPGAAQARQNAQDNIDSLNRFQEYYSQGLESMSREEWALAIQQFQAALQLQPNHESATLSLNNAQAKLRDIEYRSSLVGPEVSNAQIIQVANAGGLVVRTAVPRGTPAGQGSILIESNQGFRLTVTDSAAPGLFLHSQSLPNGSYQVQITRPNYCPMTISFDKTSPIGIYNPSTGSSGMGLILDPSCSA